MANDDDDKTPVEEAEDPHATSVAGVDKPTDPADTKDFSEKIAVAHVEELSDVAKFEELGAPVKHAEDVPDVGQAAYLQGAPEHAIGDGSSSNLTQVEKPEPPPLLPEGDDTTAAGR